jgi:CrcB protein
VDGWCESPLDHKRANTLGLLLGVALQEVALLLAGGATLGSYTTFSTWMFETQRLGEDGRVMSAG